MLFDFEKFSSVTASVYPPESTYSINDALDVFRYYFTAYEEFTKRPHPPIKSDQIVSIVQRMPYLGDVGWSIEVDHEWYHDMIDRHFKTRYRRCDYNINHFFSGKIRLLRFYEMM